MAKTKNSPVASVFRSHQRQVHLDFHTSPFIPDVGKEFDAEAFAATMEQARVNSVTVFAKCHHGMCYYPTETGTTHPALDGRDLLGEQIEALHRRGIRAPIYTTVAWEEDAAGRHPEWRQLNARGGFAGWSGLGPDGKPGHLGMWKFLNFLEPEYQDYFEAHLREIIGRYGKEVDGFFFDILMFAPDGGFAPASLAFKEKHGLAIAGAAAFDRFQCLAQREFARKFTRIVQGLRPRATIFYNAPNDGNMDRGVGPRARADFQTHNEIESLPSGFWGYFHFPRMARAQSRWGKPWMGMTGRFQKMWGDFGGIKPQPALEFECFRAQAMGGASSVGDQLPPRGVPDPAAYELIGNVYRQWEAAEPFYEGATPVQPRIGIFSASYAGLDGGKSEEGAVLLCEEAKYDCAVLDGYDELDGFEVLILPDSTVVDAKLAAKLRRFHGKGGRLLISHRGGFGESGKPALDFLPLRFAGEVAAYPTYWRVRKKFDPSMAGSDRVFYEPGLNLRKGKGVKVLVDRVLPYFKRSDVRFSSHFQTPPVDQVDRHPAVVEGDGFVYCADPLFREFRQTGNPAVRLVWRRLMERLAGPPPFGQGLPSTVNVYPLRKGKDLLLTLLHYVPVRKAIDIDVVDERSTFAGETLRFESNQVSRVLDFSSGGELEKEGPGAFRLPPVKGRLLLRVPDYF